VLARAADALAQGQQYRSGSSPKRTGCRTWGLCRSWQPGWPIDQGEGAKNQGGKAAGGVSLERKRKVR